MAPPGRPATAPRGGAPGSREPPGGRPAPSRRALLGLAIALAGGGLVLWAVFAGETDEDRIRAQLLRLEELCRVGGAAGESKNLALHALQLSGEFASLFTDDVQVTIPEVQSLRSGREDLARTASQAQRFFTSLELSFRDPQITLGAGGRMAQVKTVTHVAAVERGGDAVERDERDTNFALIKDDEGQWLIHSVQVATRSVIPD